MQFSIVPKKERFSGKAGEEERKEQNRRDTCI